MNWIIDRLKIDPVPGIAEYLQVLESLRSKPADPDLIPGVDNKEELLGSFIVTDQILWGMENGLNQDKLIHVIGKKVAEQIKTLKEFSRHLRESPYSIEMSNQDQGLE